jgi:hypothetical protein
LAIAAAKRAGIEAGTGGQLLLPLVAVVWLWKHRRDVRELMVACGLAGLGALWTWAIVYSDTVRLRVAVASVFAGVVAFGVWAFSYLDGRAPTPSNFRAARAQSLREWDVERAVTAVTEEAVKVSDVRAEGDAVLASVTVAPGQSPADLEGLLLDRLAPTTHRLTGRTAVSVSVSRTATPGVFRVRVDTGHPLREVVLWRDL